VKGGKAEVSFEFKAAAAAEPSATDAIYALISGKSASTAIATAMTTACCATEGAADSATATMACCEAPPAKEKE
jgi:hypothetical protein